MINIKIVYFANGKRKEVANVRRKNLLRAIKGGDHVKSKRCKEKRQEKASQVCKGKEKRKTGKEEEPAKDPRRRFRLITAKSIKKVTGKLFQGN